MIEILINNVNHKWVYNSFVRKTDTPISEQKTIINNLLENGLMDSISEQLRTKFDIMPNKLVIECSEDNFEIIRIGVL